MWKSIEPYPATRAREGWGNNCLAIRSAYSEDEELEDIGVSAVWFELVDDQEQHGADEADRAPSSDPDRSPSRHVECTEVQVL
jgi:hypothetical protein